MSSRTFVRRISIYVVIFSFFLSVYPFTSESARSLVFWTTGSQTSVIEYKSKTCLDPVLSPRLNVGPPPFPFLFLSFYLTALNPPYLSAKSSYTVDFTLLSSSQSSYSPRFFLRLSDFPFSPVALHVTSYNSDHTSHFKASLSFKPSHCYQRHKGL